jgi:hypothetical protein
MLSVNQAIGRFCLNFPVGLPSKRQFTLLGTSS